MSFLNIMLCLYFFLEAALQDMANALQDMAKNNLTKKQIDAEIQATVTHKSA